jgi:hypothetical protein
MTASVKRAVDLSREFYGFDPRHIKKIEFNCPKTMVSLGHCAQIDYVTDKYDGIERQYYHQFKGPCVVFASAEPQPNGQNALIIIGKFKIDDRGIVG